MMSYKALGAIPCVFLVFAISFATAFGNDDSAAFRLFSSDKDNSEPIPTGPAVPQSESADFSPEYSGCGDLDCCQSCCCPRWAATADVMVMERAGNTNDFGNFGREIEVGPRISLIRQTPCCDFEILYFSVDGTSRTVVTAPLPADAGNPGVGQPVGPGQPLASFGWSSRLYNVELNARWNPSSQLTVLGGFRWAQYRDEFGPYLDHIDANNNLYGFQVGADTCLWQRGCFSIEGLCKVGIYGNHAKQITTEPLGPFVELGTSAVTGSHTDFIGELGLQARYQLTRRFAFRAGYELLWLDGLAIATAQNVDTSINTSSTVLYQGATAGFEFSF
ncbi:MAG: BBP7 family outer membrane beta-barrel protein [Thermoguttaceae bacterium]|jgi:hypothetical protein